jgi:glucokinase
LLKDALALEIYRYTGEVLGLLLSNIVCNLSPEKIILFGGVLYAGEVILQPTLKYYNDYTLSVFKDTVAIEISNIGSEEMGILGAAALLLD